MEGTLGEIRMFGGTFAPRGWMYCAGQQMSISNYEALYALIGTTYGGDGVSNFNLPTLGGRVIIGTGQKPGTSNYPLGIITGTENVTVLASQMPVHTHTVSNITTSAVTDITATPVLKAADTTGSGTPSGGYFGSDGSATIFSTTTDSVQLSTNSVTVNAVSGPVPTVGIGGAGGSQAHNNLQPYTSVYYIICVLGVFPMRN